MSGEFIRFREATVTEKALLAELLKQAKQIGVDPDWLDSARICPLDDGGMGSFRIASPRSGEHNRVLGEVVSEGHFSDEDGVLVLVSLSVDSSGDPFEVDIWKSDFSPVIRFPSTLLPGPKG